MLSSESPILVSMYDGSDLHEEMFSRWKQYQQAGKVQRMGGDEIETIELKSSAGNCVWRAREPRPTANMCTDQAAEVESTKYLPSLGLAWPGVVGMQQR